MRIKDIISHGKVYAKVKKIDFNASKDKEITLDSFFKTVELLKSRLEKSSNEYNSILLLMLNDKYLLEKIVNSYNKELSVTSAVKDAIDFYRNELLTSNNQYIQERTVDLDNLEYLILSSINDNKVDKLDNDYIIVCEELYPFFLLDNINHIKGIISLRGGRLSHAAIYARGHGIPYVLVDKLDFDFDKEYLIDTSLDLISDNCPLNIIEEEKYDDIEKYTVNTNINIYANIFNNMDINSVIKYKFKGVGLYRTEFIFMNLNKPMPLDIQYDVYFKAANKIYPNNITFRTFDIGDDKKLPYLKTRGKGVFNYLHNLDLFKTQLEALVKANNKGNVKIMFPMIRTFDEYKLLKNITLDIANKGNYNIPQIGMMLETKEALMHLEDFKTVDFISLGTNDLTKELFNIDRDQINRIELYYNELLKVIKRVVEFTKKHNIPLSICGEIAANGKISKDLIEIGVTNFSVSTECFRGILSAINE